ncbi:hypothetical protein F5X99DRAFT_432496 [Biscogniauxia marginata]|nr:hypothetical protein F5X99DRAFT_432496 [Biscogniauxia marginata]
MSYLSQRHHSNIRSAFQGLGSRPASAIQRRNEPRFDVWTAKDDPNHRHRVELHRRRSSSVLSNRVNKPVYQRPPTAHSTIRKEGKNAEDLRTSLLRDQSLSRPKSSLERVRDDVPQRGISPAEFKQTFQEELAHFDNTIDSLRQDEWATPPTPRARARRIDGKQFSQQCAQDLKCWSSAQGFLYGQTSSSLRDTDQVQRRGAYIPGVIFSAPYHTPSSNDEMWVSVNDPNLTATPFGTVCSKYRKMIVLKTYGEHCTCLPIYTHNGLGLEAKEFPGEFVSIRDVADFKPEPNEGPHRGILAVNHRYAAPATIEGMLHPESFSRQRLFELVDMNLEAQDITINKAYLLSCTNGKSTDFAAAARIFREASNDDKPANRKRPGTSRSLNSLKLSYPRPSVALV